MADSRPRFVFDTNVIVSAALLRRSVPRQAFDKALDIGAMLISTATMSELDEVLRRPGLNKYVTEDERRGGPQILDSRLRWIGGEI